MQRLVLVMTRSPFFDASQRLFGMSGLAATQLGFEVKLYLFYDGVLAAKKECAMAAKIKKYIKKGIRVFVDDREFQARGLGEMIDGIQALHNPVSELVDEMMKDNTKVIVV